MKRNQFLLSSILFLFSQCSAYASSVGDDDEDYCFKAGGTVKSMVARFHTRSGVVNGWEKPFCQFIKNNGFLVIGLDSFSSSEGNIAATYMKTLQPFDDDTTLLKGKYRNPSANFCQNIGGTTIAFAASGNFIDEKGESDVCVFGDGSMVSAWTLIYMANHREGYDEVKARVASRPLF